MMFRKSSCRNLVGDTTVPALRAANGAFSAVVRQLAEREIPSRDEKFVETTQYIRRSGFPSERSREPKLIECSRWFQRLPGVPNRARRVAHLCLEMSWMNRRGCGTRG